MMSRVIVDNPSKRLLMANPRGFCAGVTRAISAVEEALRHFGAPVYVRRPIVHNRRVVDRLSAMGAVFVQELDEVPKGSIAILSAHGVASSILHEAAERDLRVLDTTCPLVARVHRQVADYYHAGRMILLVGHRGHPEIVGTVGQLPAGAIIVVGSAAEVKALELAEDTPVAYAVQTTFAMQEAAGIITAIERRFRDVAQPRSSDICYATTNRQSAVAQIAVQAEHVLVVGDEMSSNARRLVEVALSAGCPGASLVTGAERLDVDRLADLQTIGLTAAASSPPEAIDDVRLALEAQGFRAEEVAGRIETAVFRPVSMAFSPSVGP